MPQSLTYPAVASFDTQTTTGLATSASISFEFPRLSDAEDDVDCRTALLKSQKTTCHAIQEWPDPDTPSKESHLVDFASRSSEPTTWETVFVCLFVFLTGGVLIAIALSSFRDVVDSLMRYDSQALVHMFRNSF